MAKGCMKEGNKTKALAIMRKRKYLEKLLSDTYAQLENLEALVCVSQLWRKRRRRWPSEVPCHHLTHSFFKRKNLDCPFITTQTATLEFAPVQEEVLAGLEIGNKAMKEMEKEMNIEAVQRILDDAREGQEFAKVRSATKSPPFLSIFVC